MKINISLILNFLAITSLSVSNAYSEETEVVETDPVMSPTNYSKTFELKELIGTSLMGLLDPACGGWCVTGVCAHFNIGFSLRRGIFFYTIISPRIEHALPELLISAYDEVGEEPLKEWRDTFGAVVSTVNQGVGSLTGIAGGLGGGRADRKMQGIHQTVTFKEVDIIGHPLAILPDLINDDASPNLSGYKVPDYGQDQEVEPVEADEETKEKLDKEGFGFDLSEIKIPNMEEIVDSIKQKIIEAIGAFDIIQKFEEALETIEKIKDIKEYVATIMEGIEAASMASIRSSVYGNLANPRFAAPRLFCPTNIKPFQPYYLSFADAFWWRTGYPLTDGPISGSDHTREIINPFSNDTLQKTNNFIETLTKENWGNLYPRDGTINQSHDGKAASVLAWRALDVLKTVVEPGYRVGVPLPRTIEGGRWQMIFPEVKSCRADPYYSDDTLTVDSFKPSGFGGYAWNYYATYECCSNTKGELVGELSLPKICLPGDIPRTEEETCPTGETYIPLTGGGFICQEPLESDGGE